MVPCGNHCSQVVPTPPCPPHPPRAVPFAESCRPPAPDLGLLSDTCFSFFLCCRFLKVVKEPEPRGRPPRRNPSICLSPQAWRPREHSSRAGARPSEPQPEVTSPRHAAACLFFLFFLQHAPRGPAPPMAQAGHLLGASLSPSGPHPTQDHGGS